MAATRFNNGKQSGWSGTLAERADLSLSPTDADAIYIYTDYAGRVDRYDGNDWVKFIENGAALVSTPAPAPIASSAVATMNDELAADPLYADAGSTYQTTDNDLGSKGLEYIVTNGGLARQRRNTGPFIPSSVSALTLDSADAGTELALSPYTETLQVTNLELTSTINYAVVAFGTSIADAKANLAIVAGKSTAGAVVWSGKTDLVLGGTENIGVPAFATHAVFGNGVAGANQTLMVIPGSGGV